MKEATIFRTHVTGLSHHAYSNFVNEIKVGTALTLWRDKTNRHDDKAIGVCLDDIRIGWVPKQDEPNSGQGVLAKLMDADVELTCTVCVHDHTATNLQRRLFVVIGLKQPKVKFFPFQGDLIEKLLKDCPHRGMVEPTVHVRGFDYLREDLVDAVKADAFRTGVKQGGKINTTRYVNLHHPDISAIAVGTALHAYIEQRVEAARKEGIKAGKNLNTMNCLNNEEILGYLLPKDLVDHLKAEGVKEKEAPIANKAYNNGYTSGRAKGKEELASTIENILNGNISFYDVAAKELGISRKEAKHRWNNTAHSRDRYPYEDMVVRVVRPEYYKTMSTVQLELRSATQGTAMNPMIPTLKVRPGDTLRVSIIKREA